MNLLQKFIDSKQNVENVKRCEYFWDALYLMDCVPVCFYKQFLYLELLNIHYGLAYYCD